MKIYPARKKGFVNYLLIGFFCLPLVVFALDPIKFSNQPFIVLPLLIPLTLLLWIYFDTSYKIEKSKLIYRSGFLRGEIEISSIKEIANGKTMWSGVRPALATNGLIIRYNTYDEIYIAPESNDDVIADLLTLNPLIRVNSEKNSK